MERKDLTGALDALGSALDAHDGALDAPDGAQPLLNADALWPGDEDNPAAESGAAFVAGNALDAGSAGNEENGFPDPARDAGAQINVVVNVAAPVFEIEGGGDVIDALQAKSAELAEIVGAAMVGPLRDALSNMIEGGGE